MFATDLAGLARLRAALRERVLASPLFDTRLFARRLEAALAGIWHEHCKPPSADLDAPARNDLTQNVAIPVPGGG